VPTPLYNTVAVLSFPVIRGLYRLSWTGLEKLPAEGGFVLAANHTSSLDPWPLGFPLWPKRQLHFMGKVELFNPILGPILRAGGAFPVRRGEGDMEAIEHATRICKSGGIVTMFPEGTRQTKGLRKKFAHRPRSGSARIAMTAGVPLVPAAVKGSDKLMRLHKLKVAYGAPIPYDDLLELPPRDAHQEATDRLMARIYELHARL
jgi:1-acyl-sn-glycerol-3-phosphate acyltransferase